MGLNRNQKEETTGILVTLETTKATKDQQMADSATSCTQGEGLKLETTNGF